MAGENQVGKPTDRAERRAQVVADRGEEFGFLAIGAFRQFGGVLRMRAPHGR